MSEEGGKIPISSGKRVKPNVSLATNNTGRQRNAMDESRSTFNDSKKSKTIASNKTKKK